MVTAEGISDGERRRRVGTEASGQASARGSTCSKEWATAELLDTVRRREVDGGRGYSGKAASRWHRGELAHAGVTSVPARAGASS